MKKLFWVRLSKWQKTLAATALESGADALVLPRGCASKAKSLGRITVIAPDGDLKLGRAVKEFKINSKADEAKIVAEKGRIPVIITNKDWTIIPLENLISKTSNLIQTVTDAKKAQLALTTMEVGADGVCLETSKASEIVATGKAVRAANNEKLNLVKAKITEITPLGIADRVCIDTTAILKPGQGVLAGDSSAALFLVFNENVPSPYCDPRPFRVNTGAVHAYIRCPGDQTAYLADLKAGSEVLIVDEKGNTFPLAVGRLKIEKRPMLHIKGKIGTKPISLVMQNAETIRLTKPSGKPVSITHLKKGDEVLAYAEDAGRHFGVKVRETITER